MNILINILAVIGGWVVLAIIGMFVWIFLKNRGWIRFQPPDNEDQNDQDKGNE